ncbi:MAG: integral rane transport protein [Ilumatobacteraceae bacterium]|nr:integral rane transport protein [Ilumatobacteraceae bacterium]
MSSTTPRDTSPRSTSPRIKAAALDEQQIHDRRWLILGVLCLSVFVIVIDGTIINVALPTLVRELGATTSQLQWVVDAYTLVFAGLLLAAGSLGDRFGRKGFLMTGMALFGLFSGLGALATSPGQLIAARGAMGIGAALIFPATLAILVNVFTDTRERPKAIALWAATSGLSVALGPVTGGFLLEHFFWGSVLLVNVPIVVIAIVLIARYVPTSRDTTIQRFDPVGMVLSIVGVSLLVWAVIEGPSNGWLSPTSLGAFAVAIALLVAFIRVEQRSSHPMLDVSVFSNARFSAGSASVTIAFFALFGFIFMVTQYFQFVRGYGTLSAGVHTVPFAVFTGIAAPSSAKLAARFGAKRIVAAGLTSMAIGLFGAGALGADSPYVFVVVVMLFLGAGLGLVNAPATEAIMGSLSPEKAGVGSAVNDTTRELGGTLGVAIVGSLFSSVYAASLVDGLKGMPIPAAALAAAKDSVGAAVQVAAQAGQTISPAAGAAVKQAVDHAFMDGFRVASWVAAAVALGGALLAYRFLPAHADEHSFETAADGSHVDERPLVQTV